MFRNWLRYGDTEMVNNARVAAYASNGLKPVGYVVPDCDDCPDIAEAVGDGVYDTPVLDGAPWVREDDPDTADFAGVMAVSVTGLSDSTTTVEVVERVGDGGLVGSRRSASKTIQVTADLIARTPAGAAVGMEWLASVLHPPCSSSGGCGGDVLHLFSACPQTCSGQTDPDADPIRTRIPVDTLSVERGTGVEVSTTARTNLIPNPSFEEGTDIATGWSAYSGGINGGITREVRGDLSGVTSGSKAQRIVSSAQDNAPGSEAGISISGIPATPGPAYARVDVAALLLPPGHHASLIINCYDASSTRLQQFRANRTSSGTLDLTFTIPAGTTTLAMFLCHGGTGAGESGGARVETVWDSALVVMGGPVDYFDGSTPDNPTYVYDWTGQPNASTSTMTGTGSWLEFTKDTTSPERGRIITGLLPGVCDEVTVSWVVTATHGPVDVYVQMLDSTGAVVQVSAVTSLADDQTTTIPVRINPTPGFPEDWRTAISVNGDVIASVSITQRPLLTVEQCVQPYRRTLHNVVTVDGPKIVEEHTLGDLTDGSSAWRVEWTWVAAEPHVWHEPKMLLADVAGKANTQVYAAPGIQIGNPANVTASATSCPRPAPSLVACGDNANLPGLMLPPQAPVLPDPSVMAVTGYTRRMVEIPADLLPVGVGALTWTFENDARAKLGVRVRIYHDTDPAFVAEAECSFVQEFYIDYLKGGQTLTIDGPGNEVYVYCGLDDLGQPIYAPALRNLRGTYGGPFRNEVVGCNRSYVIVVDVPTTYTATGGSEYASGESQGDLTWSLDVTRRG